MIASIAAANNPLSLLARSLKASRFIFNHHFHWRAIFCFFFFSFNAFFSANTHFLNPAAQSAGTSILFCTNFGKLLFSFLFHFACCYPLVPGHPHSVKVARLIVVIVILSPKDVTWSVYFDCDWHTMITWFLAGKFRQIWVLEPTPLKTKAGNPTKRTN